VTVHLDVDSGGLFVTGDDLAVEVVTALTIDKAALQTVIEVFGAVKVRRPPGPRAAAERRVGSGGTAAAPGVADAGRARHPSD
jgi:hypothetical protein